MANINFTQSIQYDSLPRYCGRIAGGMKVFEMLMSAESPFIEQARRPRLSNVLAMAGLVNRRCHRPRALPWPWAARKLWYEGFFELLDS